MASNLSTIGFEFATDEDFVSSMTTLAASAATAANGAYAIWHSPTGAELWFHLEQSDPSLKVVGVTPFFEGESKIPIRIDVQFQRDGDNAHEGAIQGAYGAPDDFDRYPIVFDAVDYRNHSASDVPFETTARISAFAFSLRAFSSLEDFDNAQSEEFKYAPQSFVPLGMFSVSSGDDENTSPPASHAMFNGTIRSARLATNEVTGRQFYVLAVESIDATFDVVADPSIVEGEIKTGAIAEVHATLFGRLLR